MKACPDCNSTAGLMVRDNSLYVTNVICECGCKYVISAEDEVE